MAQTRQQDRTPPPRADQAGPAPSARLSGTGSRLHDAFDRLIDDIDDVLEENAETFVKGYVQQGGE